MEKTFCMKFLGYYPDDDAERAFLIEYTSKQLEIEELKAKAARGGD